MEAVAALLHGMPLQSEESDRGDLMEAKSQLFLKYFTLFMNLLNDCSEGGGVGGGGPTGVVPGTSGPGPMVGGNMGGVIVMDNSNSRLPSGSGNTTTSILAPQLSIGSSESERSAPMNTTSAPSNTPTSGEYSWLLG